MKIAYLISHDIRKNDGVVKKIIGQIEIWEQCDYEVEVYSLVPKKGLSELDIARQYEYSNSLELRYSLFKGLISDLNEFKPDIVYYRYDLLSVLLMRVLKKYKVVIELNSNDLGEFKSIMLKKKDLKSILRYYYVKYTKKFLLNRVSGIISVTYEILNDEIIKNLKIPTITIPNGINLNKYASIKYEVLSQRKSLFFMGSPNQEWHGIDIIEKIALNLKNYNFHIVGIDGISTSNVFYHGYLHKNEYLPILKQCHICIGTLALYRKNMKEACPLKVREYLAYGYPILIGYKDTSFLKNKLPSWVKTIDSEKDLNYDEIALFIEKNCNIIITHQQISFLSTYELETNRLNYFCKIVN